MMEVKIKHYKLQRPSRWRKVAACLWRGRWYLPTIALLLLVPLAKLSPWTVEAVFSRSWYAAVAYLYGGLTSFFPFSLLEAGILVLTALAVFLVIRGVQKYLRREPVREDCKRVLLWVCRGISVIVALFMLFCGYNYYRPSFAETCGLVVRPSTDEELYALCLELTQQANELRALLPQDELGTVMSSEGSLALAQQAKTVFAGLSEQYDRLPAYPITPKPVLFSRAMSMMQITGVFCPVTFEANVNMDAPDFTIPATMCHELSHTRGFMREDEANFIGYLACMNSNSPEFRYSGVMLALVHVQNRLAANAQLYGQAYAERSDAVRRDFAYNHVYWGQFEGPVGDVATAVNNTYLQLNNQTGGVQSYGYIVDLLLADYRMRHGLQ